MEKLQEIEFDKQFNNYAKESLLKEKTLAKLNRIKHSEILNRTWSQAAKLKEYKELEENILRKGCTQALIKTFIKQTQETELPAIVKDIKTQIHADLIKDSPKIIEKHEVSKEKLVLNIEKLKDANKSALGEDLKHREEKKIIVKNYSCMTDYGVLRVLRFPPYPKPKPKLKLKHK